MTAEHVSLISIKKITGKRPPGLNRRRHLMTLLTGFLFLALLSADIIAGEAHQAFFAEPTSGRRVTHYEIELPVKLDQRQTFKIPDDCSAVMRAIDSGVTFKGNIIDRRLWQKTESDCRYHGFLNRHPQHVIEDHVSGYDFKNAKIADLPLDPRCAQKGADPSGCNPAATDEFGMLRHFPISSPAGAVPERADCRPCELRNGRFRGYVFVDKQGVRCKIDANATGLRLIAVDFSDINGDRILDVVLRFIPIGPGSTRTLLILPLTRLDASAPFSIPGTAPPEPAGSSE